MILDYDTIEHLRRSPAWSLLRANSAPLVLSFLSRVFIEGNRSNLPASELAGELDDELFALNQRLGDGTFPKVAPAYLDDWASPDRGWLRKHYPPGSDEAHYDISPAVEKALAWVRELPPQEFVGTESRLNTIFDLLRQIVHGADSDPGRRLAELRRQRVELDAQIARAERGDIDVLDEVGQRDRYQQFARIARELLGDFRQVEENFRQLDRAMREQIATWAGSKGSLLEEVLANRASIAESDQGRSFRAFYDFLLSAAKQAELTELLHRLEAVASIPEHDARLSRIHFDWIDASERTQTTVRMLSEQLRRFLDDRVWLENRRVFELLRSIEVRALQLRDAGTALEIGMDVEDPRVPVALPTERPLHRPAQPVELIGGPVEDGEQEFDSSALLAQVHVDRQQLAQRVLASLGPRAQVPLEDVVRTAPLEHGLAELIGYLSLHEPGLDVVFDEDGRTHITWTSEDADRIADVPRVTFTRHGGDRP
jgi:hypothetical protein